MALSKSVKFSVKQNCFFYISNFENIGKGWIVPLIRAGPVLRNFRGWRGGRLDGPHLTRLLGVVARNRKERSKARQKSFWNYLSHFFTQASIEVTWDHHRSNDTNGFSLITFALKAHAPHWTSHPRCGFAGWRDFSTFDWFVGHATLRRSRRFWW